MDEPDSPGTQGRFIGPYGIERELGRGTMGRVFLARDRSNGREVAIKTLALSREFAGVELTEAQGRFSREAEAAGRLKHPDIVQVLETGEIQGLAYIVMERLHGTDLTAHVSGDSLLPVSSVVAIGARVAAALAHAHAQGVVHRDIKPANIMIDGRRNQVKVMDFGIARLSDASRTRTGLVLGSPSYMSPEQLAGRVVDGRSDLYSLGVVLFQTLAARLPISGHSMAGLIHAVTHDPAPDLRALRPGVPDELADVISILLEKRPELRYRDGLALAGDLRMIASRLQRRSEPSERHPVMSPVSDAQGAGPPDQPPAMRTDPHSTAQEVAARGEADLADPGSKRAQSGP